jgi:DNA-binding MarR family transcriptional regulator
MEELDKVLHQPIRTKIMAYLATQKSADYTTLRDMFSLTDGHMTTHMKELIENNYVSVSKEFLNNKPRTTYSITKTGTDAFLYYVQTLKKIISLT